MPTTTPKKPNIAAPEMLRPYRFHGVDLVWSPGDREAVSDCPWCDKPGKFNVSMETGLWKCWSCGPDGGGNAILFLRELWDRSDQATEDYDDILADRGLSDVRTLMAWGVVKSNLGRNWMIPGYSPEGKLTQLYKRIWTGLRWELRPTPTLAHALHGVQLYDRNKSAVYLHESWGNALAMWEALKTAKLTETGTLAQTASDSSSLLAFANVLSVANCGAVGRGLERYLGLFANKEVFLCFDSDHPGKGGTDGAGLAATKRAARLLSESKEPPLSVKYLKWGAGGYDPALKSGYDVRDLLCH